MHLMTDAIHRYTLSFQPFNQVVQILAFKCVMRIVIVNKQLGSWICLMGINKRLFNVFFACDLIPKAVPQPPGCEGSMTSLTTSHAYILPLYLPTTVSICRFSRCSSSSLPARLPSASWNTQFRPDYAIPVYVPGQRSHYRPRTGGEFDLVKSNCPSCGSVHPISARCPASHC